MLGSCCSFTAFLTAYYTFRLYFRVFEGPLIVPTRRPAGMGTTTTVHADQHAHASASAVRPATRPNQASTSTSRPAHHGRPTTGTAMATTATTTTSRCIMILPLVVLAIGAVLAGYPRTGRPARPLGDFLGDSPSFQLAYEVAARAHRRRRRLWQPTFGHARSRCTRQSMPSCSSAASSPSPASAWPIPAPERPARGRRIAPERARRHAAARSEVLGR